MIDLDVTSSQKELDAKIAEALEIYGGIDVLVNAAGYIEAGTMEEFRSVPTTPHKSKLIREY